MTTPDTDLPSTPPMSRLRQIAAAARDAIGRRCSAHSLHSMMVPLLIVGSIAAAYTLATHAPLQTVASGSVGVRSNLLTGGQAQFREGSVLVVPGLQSMRQWSLRDQLYHPPGSASAKGDAPMQSVEGLSIGVDLGVRYALDPARVGALAGSLPSNIEQDIVQPAVQGLVYKIFARYTVREIFTTKRGEIQQAIETELRPRLAADGVLLRGVQLGKVDLPEDYRRGMDALLAEELAGEKMRYTLELKQKQVQETELVAQADKVRRETNAQAAAREQIIAAQAQEEAMKHVLPFKQKQIEQRQLEAEADKVARIRGAEANAQARRIESQGEADSRQKLADAEVYRLQKVGIANAEQMAREGALITRHPLLIQKTMADKLSDKIQVIIAPPPTNGDFLGSALLGSLPKGTPGTPGAPAGDAADAEGSAQ
ncbi:MAG TPA: SPFH domain-containing protein [Burkholderiaceae bacterium]|jgi:regulator of protease activity HflC (stomatin/prohibitin superfamily)